MGFSIAARMSSAAAARREARRLFGANSEPEPGTTAERVDVPGVRGARGVVLRGGDDGMALTGVEVVWTTGSVLHELFVFGRRSAVRPGHVVRAVRRIDARVTAP